MVDLWIDFWVRETETGQQVAQPREKYMMMMMMMMMMTMMINTHCKINWNVVP